MALNHTAQLETAQAATKLMRNGGRIVFVTSHWCKMQNYLRIRAARAKFNANGAALFANVRENGGVLQRSTATINS
jgi:NAD(P)-dependent dehydrogenase (short-subunit alcohol dehydrogenase family)